MASPFRDDLVKLVDEMKQHDAVPIGLLMSVHDLLGAWLQKGGEHVAPVPDIDPEAIKAELAAAEKRAAELRSRVAAPKPA